MRTKRIVAGAVVLALMGAPACSGGEETPGESTLVTVVGAFYPLVFVAEEVGLEHVTVENLTPPGVEPHDLELTADQVGRLSKADLVIYVGRGFQPAIEDATSSLDDSQKLDVLEGNELQTDGDEADPHIWLDPVSLSSIAMQTADRLAEIDPSAEDAYKRNAKAVEAELEKLDALFTDGLADCERRDIVTSHAAFGYLAKRYDLNQVSVAGTDPESEPSPERLADVIRFVEDNDISSIFFEERGSSDVAETIASETGAETAVLSPLESAPEAGDYFDVMEANLKVLTKALDCA